MLYSRMPNLNRPGFSDDVVNLECNNGKEEKVKEKNINRDLSITSYSACLDLFVRNFMRTYTSM